MDHPFLRIGRDHRIADGIQRDLKQFYMRITFFLQGKQLFLRRKLLTRQIPGTERENQQGAEQKKDRRNRAENCKKPITVFFPDRGRAVDNLHGQRQSLQQQST